MSTGTLIVESYASDALKGNPLGDPYVRDLPVYLPPGYGEGAKTYPLLLALAGFMGSGPQIFERDLFGEDLKRRLDRLIGSGECPPVIVAAPDCFTRVGGSQYINSSAVGRYEDYLVQEIVPHVKNAYRVGRVGVFGHSSGGYGALVLGMRHPSVFEAVASHAGDSNFELCYLPGFLKTLDAFRSAGGPAGWLDEFWSAKNKKQGKYLGALNTFGMAAHYSPNPDSPHAGIDWPFDLETGEFLPEVWKRWQAWDPVRMAPSHADALRALRLIYIDCGSRDEYAMHWGARAVVRALQRIGVDPHYEEFTDGHRGIAYRYDVSLPLLAKALQA